MSHSLFPRAFATHSSSADESPPGQWPWRWDGRRKAIREVLLSCGPLIAAFGFASLYSPPPVITFVEMRDEEYGRAAVFRITNRSQWPYSYFGSGNAPYGDYRVHTSEGWVRHSMSRGCGMGCSWKTIPPHSSVEYSLYVNQLGITSPFSVGGQFVRGTKEEVEERCDSLVFVLSYLLRQKLDEWGYEACFTWSDTASP